MVPLKSSREWITTFLALALAAAVGMAAPSMARATAPTSADDATERKHAAERERGEAGEQSAEAAASEQVAGQGQPDFLFGTPRGSFGVRGGWTFASADSDIYAFVSDILTLEKSDFNAPTIAFDLAWLVNDRIDAVFGVEYSRASKSSEYRDFVDLDDLPITQETKLTRAPVTASLKFYLTERGRQVGQYAWVPRSIGVYAGGGGGFIWYRFEQFGDFVDFLDLTIFTSEFISDGWAPTVHVFGGVDFKLSTKAFLTFEARYAWAKADMDQDFVGFDKIDLGGLRATAGIYWLF